ncbi:MULTISPECIES: hypothetical protein [Burkholderia]|uniref:hypothetical protein n=1 Tax=Burkholderia TaxID=32008 RepID=UPI0012959D6B|nr:MULTISPECIES: hypothetical protein [Burkholderia]QGA37236.1 hypothetical protein GAS19_05855 [Burkholderia glumae]
MDTTNGSGATKGRAAKRLTFDQFMRERITRFVLDVSFSEDPGFVVKIQANRVPRIAKAYGLAVLYYPKIRQYLSYLYDKQWHRTHNERQFVHACERSGISDYCDLRASQVITTCNPDRLYLIPAELFNEMMELLRADLAGGESPCQTL